MILIDSHTHLYLSEFGNDRPEVIGNAIEKGVLYMLLPNIDGSTVTDMLSVCDAYPDHCFPMIGLHPGSVGERYENELHALEGLLTEKPFYAIGEIGIDLYWDKTYAENQKSVLLRQFDWAIKYDLPVVLHSRNAIDEIISIIEQYNNRALRGVFHCFSGNSGQALRIISLGFLLGIGGVVTFKNSGLTGVIENLSLDNILLETDAPYLAPVPYRGKRNQSAYLPIIAGKIAEIKKTDIEKVAEITTQNALRLFRIKGIF